MNEKINVEVVYASETLQKVIPIQIAKNSSILDAILLSNILMLFPEINLDQQKIGVFSQTRQLTDKVAAGDRIEIYRKLTIDPKEARRAKAKHNKK